jgi:hypothetical protein
MESYVPLKSANSFAWNMKYVNYSNNERRDVKKANNYLSLGYDHQRWPNATENKWHVIMLMYMFLA